ncbi:ETC complex I subunit [Sphingomonas aliaeris]|uniref:ETC complex I subunit n=1 Tax=Sphingomonas aliaeris TaxID=2759526 RepID=A0A974NVL2_9SPHN|nr:NADH dehydrogenase ubiquinone Fe-S protein 4 [Sphingomonas aliaeris]QQV77715.1 ETC complex I subunit [Sphingomonas aliaeris]
MPRALIFQRPSLASPILQRGRPGWVVQFDTDRPQHADPLTGWAGGADPVSQVQVQFPSRESAIDYCRREGHEFTVIEPTRRKLLLQSYADNFR